MALNQQMPEKKLKIDRSERLILKISKFELEKFSRIDKKNLKISYPFRRIFFCKFCRKFFLCVEKYLRRCNKIGNYFV